MWLLRLAVVLCLHTQAFGFVREWCPPSNFKELLQKRSNSTRTSIITEIHGEIKRTGTKWGIFTNGHQLSRFMYHYIGALGFNKIHLNVMYNGTVHPTPPTVEEIYPHAEYCVAEWYQLGVIVWQPFTFGGPVKDWAIDPRNNQPTMEKDVYKSTRGINPTFEGIKTRKDADWVLVIDIDEYLVPVNWHPANLEWCRPNNPTLISAILGQMQATATERILHSFKDMVAKRSHRRSPEPCQVGFTENHKHECQEAAAFIFPVYFWSSYPQEKERVDNYPLLRSRHPMAYDFNVARAVNMTDHEEPDTQYQKWKSIYKVSIAPLLTGPKSMHSGTGFTPLAPRKYHGGLSFDLAHVKKHCGVSCDKVLKRDNRLHGLFSSFKKCMDQLSVV